MLRKLIAAVGLALLSVGCSQGGGGPATFLSRGPGSAALIQWQQAPSGAVTGTYTYDHSAGTAPGESLSTTTTPFTGSVDGGSVALTFTSVFGIRANVTGTLSGSVLALNVPQANGTMQQETFTAASTSDFNHDVAALRGQISSGNARAARAERARRQAGASASAAARAQGQAAASAQDSVNRAADAAARANCSRYGGAWVPGGTASYSADGLTFTITAGPASASCQNVPYLGTDDATYRVTVSFYSSGMPQPAGEGSGTATQSECQSGYYPDQSAGQTRQPPGNWSVALGICLPPG